MPAGCGRQAYLGNLLCVSELSADAFRPLGLVALKGIL